MAQPATITVAGRTVGASLDLDAAEAVFAQSVDRTVGLEEEFALLDTTTLDMVPRFEALTEAADTEDPALRAQITGELISSELEIISGRGDDIAHAIELQREHRRRLVDHVRRHDTALAAIGTHPWADYREQHNIDTEHYRRVVDGLGYVARRNNTFSLHVHVGVQGADRAVQVCDRLRPVLPLLLALSASSPLLEGWNTNLHSARTLTFTRTFPRCGVPDAFGSWASYRDYLETLIKVGSIVEATQVWWSIRPHLRHGTVEVRIADAQPDAARAEALAALITACVAQAAADIDEDVPFEDPSPRMVEENLWRAIRFGLDGEMIDLATLETYPASAIEERLLAWTEPARGAHGISVPVLGRSAAQAQRAMLEEGADHRAIYTNVVAQTMTTYGTPAA
ncbi:MAG: YbdK family carboxylate-amine ligase [Solirubrobacteraceae bacterium]|nr:YbdK family carboxylate-amine ligase [Solirubrobacteraceae bacterium]